MEASLSRRTARWAGFVVKAICAAIVFVASIQTILIVGPAFETRFFPPVSKLTILAMHEDADGNTVIDAFFTKNRPCEYIGISWFKVAPDGTFDRVPVILQRREGDTSSPNRPVGSQRAGPWIIGVSSEDLPEKSFARLYHRCNPFFITVTDFYP
jgi:hypothetical protein